MYILADLTQYTPACIIRMEIEGRRSLVPISYDDTIAGCMHNNFSECDEDFVCVRRYEMYEHDQIMSIQMKMQ